MPRLGQRAPRESVDRRAAALVGVPYEEFVGRRAHGEKRCTACKTWLPVAEFGSDASRGDGLSSACRNCVSIAHRKRYTPVAVSRRGKRPVSRHDGDKRVARLRVWRAVKRGDLPHPEKLPCADCRHIGSDRLHEYDHHAGYAFEDHLNVHAVCKPCHTKRELARGTYVRRRV